MPDRFAPPPPAALTCFDCTYVGFDTDGKTVRCAHPERPDHARTVVRWFRGCPQLKEKNDRTPSA